jgi:hypothetical protein
MQPADDDRNGELDADLAAAAFDSAETRELLRRIERAGAAAFRGRSAGAALATLGYDSALDDDWPLRLRNGRAQRLLTFDTGTLTIEFEVETVLDRRALTGRITPGGEARVEVIHAAGRDQATADHVGRFSLDNIPPGAIRVACTPDGSATRVETEWITI